MDVGLLQETYVHRTNYKQLPHDYWKGYITYSNNHKTAILYSLSIANYVNKITSITLDEELLHYATAVHIKTIDDQGIIAISYYRSPDKDADYCAQIKDFFEFLYSIQSTYGYNVAFLISGDFNLQHVQWYSKTSSPAGNYLYQYMLEADIPLQLCNTAGPTYFPPQHHCKPQIDDYTFASPAIFPRVHQWKCHNIQGKDWIPSHCVLSFDVHVQLQSIRTRSRPSWRWSEADWDLVRENLRISVETLNNLLDTHTVTPKYLDFIVQQFTDSLIHSCYGAIPINYDKIDYDFCNNDTLSDWKKLRKLISNNIKSFKYKIKQQWLEIKGSFIGYKQSLRNNTIFKSMNKHFNYIRKKITKCKQCIFHRFKCYNTISDLNDSITIDNNVNIKRFWRCWNWLIHRIDSSRPPLKLSNGKFTVDPKLQVKEFESQFNNKFKIHDLSNYTFINESVKDILFYDSTVIRDPPSLNPNHPIGDEYRLCRNFFRDQEIPPWLQQQLIPDWQETTPPTPPTVSPTSPPPAPADVISDDHWLQRPIQDFELEVVWKKLVKEGKACGPDNIHNELLLEVAPVIWTLLLRIFNYSWVLSYTPKLWRIANYFPMLKPGRPDHLAKNYRPLQLTSQLSRLLSAIIANRLLTYCSETPNYNLKIWNTAFQPNKSIDDLLNNIVTDGYIALGKKTATNIVTVDISGCYDSIHLESLIYKLYHNFHLRGRILHWLYHFLKFRWARVIVGTETGTWVRKKAGLGQGESLSPVLTAMFENDFEPSYSDVINTASFVDDFTFWQNPLKYWIRKDFANEFI